MLAISVTNNTVKQIAVGGSAQYCGLQFTCKSASNPHNGDDMMLIPSQSRLTLFYKGASGYQELWYMTKDSA